MEHLWFCFVVLPSQSWILHWCSDNLFCSCVAGASKAICWHSSFYAYIWWLKGKPALFIIVWFMDVLELKLFLFFFFKTETPFLYLTSNRVRGPTFPSTAWASSVYKLLIIRIALFTVFFCCFGGKFWICRLCSIPRSILQNKNTQVHTAKSWARKNQSKHRDWVCHIIIYDIFFQMTNPSIQNDFSYYRRTLSRRKMANAVSNIFFF